MFGEGDAARTWAEAELNELIKTGGPKFIARLDEQIKKCAEKKDREAMNALRGYLDANRDRMAATSITGRCYRSNRPRRISRQGSILANFTPCRFFHDPIRLFRPRSLPIDKAQIGRML